MEYIYCPQCQGTGQVNNRTCSGCRGRSLYAWVGGYLLFWDKKFVKSEIVVIKFSRFLRLVLILLLIAFGCFGIISCLRIQLDLNWLDNYWSFFSTSRKILMLIFWTSILSDCYLYYYFERIAAEKRKIWPKTTQDINLGFLKWPELQRLNKKYKINVADALDEGVNKIIIDAWSLADKLKHAEVLPIHIFAASLSNNNVTLVVNRLGINWKILNEKIARVLAALPKVNFMTEPRLSRVSQELIMFAYDLASVAKMTSIDSLKIFEALVFQEGVVKELLFDLEIDFDQIKNVVIWVDFYHKMRQEVGRFRGLARFKPKTGMNRAMTAIATPTVDAFSQDLTQVARAGYLGYCVGREREIKEILRSIEGGRGSVVLVGQPGVGKTTIINGLVRRMVTEDVPPILQDKRLVSLSLATLISGASQPGEIERRLQLFLSEIVRSGNIILFIPNIHNMVGVKTTEGELDISEILADTIKKRLVVVLATSITVEYHRYIESKALGEALQRIDINEPEKNETIQILEVNAAFIEGKEQVYFSYHALIKALDMSVRYISDRFLPDKAINLLKDVAVYVRTKRGRQSIVQAEDVAAIVAEKTNIPVTKITEIESAKLLNLEQEIHQRMVDQNEAVQMVASSLRRARTELRDTKRPIVNLLFLGPTGVGKTELAKTVADVYFGNENRMIRLDMSEYQATDSINRLIGTPGGEEAGQLTEQIRKNPFSLLLLDEIEKAHPDILNVFLQVMDDGRLTDALGRTVNFSNVILIATSNAGTDFIQDEIRKDTALTTIQDILIREKLRPYFRPEFINRFDGVIVFKPLSTTDIQQIAQLMLNKLAKQMLVKGITLKFTDEAVLELAQLGFDPIFGARPLRRVIQERVNNALANYLLSGRLDRRDVVYLEPGGKIRVEKGTPI